MIRNIAEEDITLQKASGTILPEVLQNIDYCLFPGSFHSFLIISPTEYFANCPADNVRIQRGMGGQGSS